VSPRGTSTEKGFRNAALMLNTSSRAFCRSWDSVGGKMNRLRAGWSGVRIPGGARDLFVLQYAQTGCGAHLAFYPVGTRVLTEG
jgi:hypothetical protein